ncbi:hypothetical protein ACFLRW_02235 [Acidobacteriota bacterium]
MIYSLDLDQDWILALYIRMGIWGRDQCYLLISLESYDKIYRERVYCYELYHQLRKQLGDDYPYKLDGELDKVNHPEIHDKIGAKKPDFVVHVPGNMNNNLLVIEVKQLAASMTAIKIDLETLQLFLNKAEYFRAIMMIYGAGRNEYFKRTWNVWREMSDERIFLIWHKECGAEPDSFQLP